ncbi:MAG: ABC transporter ATP-binding protein [Elusimicrobia bacterium]|nr:ABC transporter ATP-binding protein [Elusimicrobiota bacterium]
MPGESLLEIEGITKSFGGQTVLKGISLSIKKAEFLTFLGPSGCGKTTTLRIIAGFEDPDAGRVLLEGKDVTELPPYRRDVHTVFQHYALFPHYNVFDNIAFGLRIRKLPEPEIQSRVNEALALVKLQGFENRRTSQLSGGQMQRIALARALVGRPALLLLDEPLGALDLKLRKEMQLELKSIQRKLGITFVYVTHDQEEAMTMSDRIAVFNLGRIEQLGAPRDIYERPQTSFVADFIGAANVLSATVLESRNGEVRLRLEDEVEVTLPHQGGLPVGKGQTLKVAIRPERIEVRYQDSPANTDNVWLKATMIDNVYLGNSSQIFLLPFEKPPGRVLMAVSMDAEHRERRASGATVWAEIRPSDILLLEPNSNGSHA